MATPDEVAARLHAHLCEHGWHGYTQGAGRWGDGEGACTLDVDGATYSVEQGDRDCSSSVIDCWRQALKGTPYEGALDGATYTGDMRRVFVGSGLFAWRPMGDGYIAQRGDVYLNERDHTAMCQSAEPDMLSEFCINEFGGITGGQVGDQTGAESRIRPYYDYPWDGVLAYNHEADGAQAPAPGHDMEDDMQCIIQPNGEGKLCWFDGRRVRYLEHPDEVTALNMVYRACHGRDIPCIAMGTPEAPWASRLLQACNSDSAGFGSSDGGDAGCRGHSRGRAAARRCLAAAARRRGARAEAREGAVEASVILPELIVRPLLHFTKIVRR